MESHSRMNIAVQFRNRKEVWVETTEPSCPLEPEQTLHEKGRWSSNLSCRFKENLMLGKLWKAVSHYTADLHIY